MVEISVRPAAAEDAVGIARVHIQAWREAYAAHVSAEYLASLDEGARVERWREIIASGDTDAFVAEADGVIVGWASAGAGRHMDAPLDRELEGIYITAQMYGSGAGQQLLDASIGESAAYLWVLDGNARAEAFYARNGFRRDGATQNHTLGDATVRIIRMLRLA
ncbi:GNAT family N-acetyltransferase [Paramicrobacterium fandaimingii]|uniref:GNAT family N-acetyltransferase n=1 Tax=Paramicrobacterium fandaimingii TaxID=2708079 RepID=UPI001423A846|nr:GNAT family N-acetyltransferase [Microbacterium fandaimingii]